MTRRRHPTASLFDTADEARRARLRAAGWKQMPTTPERWTHLNRRGLWTLEDAIAAEDAVAETASNGPAASLDERGDSPV